MDVREMQSPTLTHLRPLFTLFAFRPIVRMGVCPNHWSDTGLADIVLVRNKQVMPGQNY